MKPLSRRELLCRSAHGFGWLALAALLGRDALAKTHHTPRATNVILLFMDGGVSQVDSFDPKPRLKAEHGQSFGMKMDATQFDAIGKTLASPWEFQPHGAAGIPVSELFPRIGAMADDLCVIRSFLEDTDGRPTLRAAIKELASDPSSPHLAGDPRDDHLACLA